MSIAVDESKDKTDSTVLTVFVWPNYISWFENVAKMNLEANSSVRALTSHLQLSEPKFFKRKRSGWKHSLL